MPLLKNNMKLYATIESEREGRNAKKGGNEQLNITLFKGNKEIGYITFSPSEIAIEIYDSKDASIISEYGIENPVSVKEMRYKL